MEDSSLPQQRYVWGRRQSRPLKDKQRLAMEEIWTNVSLELPQNTMLESNKLFHGSMDDLWVEIGFGGGEHLAHQAEQHPQVGFIGCEPFVNGVASLVSHIQEKNLKNIRIVKDDARLLLARLPNQSVGRIYILFPDPWPKKRHNKRRIIQNEIIDTIARILKPGGLLIMATDDANYGQWMQDIMLTHPAFKLHLEDRATIYERPPHWPTTRYEKKGIACGRIPVYLEYKFNS
jgi:tRNA (guanine-N7-)-methyltransferase